MSTRSATPSRHPMEKHTVMNELRGVLLGNACQIVVSTGEDGLAETYLGISLEKFSLGSMPGTIHDDIAAINLDRFHIARQIGAAYDFALQEGDAAARTAFGEDDWNDLAIFVEGAARCSFGCELTPLANENSALRRTLDMALARMNLSHGFSLTIRQLALLADIGETAVRTSLSADGIRTEGKPAQVNAEVAEPWLRRRRGFVPTLELKESAAAVEAVAASAVFDEQPFEKALMELIDQRGFDALMLEEKTKVDETWLRSLMAGNRVNCDIDALSRLAVGLGIEVPLFVGRAVEAILRRE